MRPRNSLLVCVLCRYRVDFLWQHYAHALQPAVRAALPASTEACASVTTAFLQARAARARAAALRTKTRHRNVSRKAHND
jgi:hypothetical protein